MSTISSGLAVVDGPLDTVGCVWIADVVDISLEKVGSVRMTDVDDGSLVIVGCDPTVDVVRVEGSCVSIECCGGGTACPAGDDDDEELSVETLERAGSVTGSPAAATAFPARRTTQTT